MLIFLKINSIYLLIILTKIGTIFFTQMQTIPSYQFPQLGNATFSVGNYLTQVNYNKRNTYGFEVEAGWKDRIIRKKFSYYIKGTYAYARSKWIRVSETPQDYPWLHTQGRSSEIRGLICEGYWDSYEEINDPNNPYNTYGPKPIPGDLKYRDINGDMKIDRHDMVPLGKQRSTLNIHLSMGFSWNNLEINTLFQGASDVLYHPNEESQIMMFQGTGSFTWISERWTLKSVQELILYFIRPTNLLHQITFHPLIGLMMLVIFV